VNIHASVVHCYSDAVRAGEEESFGESSIDRVYFPPAWLSCRESVQCMSGCCATVKWRVYRDQELTAALQVGASNIKRF